MASLTDPPPPDPPVDGDPKPFWTIMEPAPPDAQQPPSDPPPPFSTVSGGLSEPPGDEPGTDGGVFGGLHGEDAGSGIPAGGAIIAESAAASAEGSSTADASPAPAPAGGFVDADLIDFAPLVAHASGFGSDAAPGFVVAGSAADGMLPNTEFAGLSAAAIGGLHEHGGHDEPDNLPPWIGMDGATADRSEVGGLPAWLGLDGAPAPLDLGLLQANGVPVEWDFSLQGRFTDWSLL